MKYPLDSSDEASLILADYLEEYDDINLADEVRNSVLEPNVDIWCHEYYYYGVGVHGVGGFAGNYVGIGFIDYVGIGFIGDVSNDFVGSFSGYGDNVGNY